MSGSSSGSGGHDISLEGEEREESVLLLVYAVRELTSELARFRRFQEQAESVSTPSIRYADTIRPPSTHPPRKHSWHENLRQKRVSLPAAATGGVIGCVLIEIGRAVVDGRLRFW
jgi:hypothetical protein